MSGSGRSAELFSRASAVIPGGVNSPVRAFGTVGGVPVFMDSGRGPYLTDADGRTYIDASGGAAVSCLGHGHPDVVAALTILPFEPPADAVYCAIRARLERAGRPIGGNDLLIAANRAAQEPGDREPELVLEHRAGRGVAGEVGC